ncbi:MAG: SAM-dependent methyltransferase, partial [Pseudomonadota bacterium]
VSTCPGPSAALAALVLSGLPSDRFHFAGFLPAKAGARRAAIDDLARVAATLILFESVRRLPKLLSDLSAALGPRPAAVAREMTKLYEEVRRGTLADLAGHYGAAGAPKGEAVVVVAPPQQEPPIGDRALDDLIRAALQRGSVRDAADKVAAETGSKRRDVYRRAVELSGAPAREKP